MAEGDRQPFADELKDDAHFDPSSFAPKPNLPLWMQDEVTDASQSLPGAGPDVKQALMQKVPEQPVKEGFKGQTDWASALANAQAGTYKELDNIQKRSDDEARAGFRDIKADMEKMRQHKPPTLEKNEPPPKADFAKGTMEWMQVAALMGAIAGGFSRRGTTTALKAFSGMMEGLHQGNMEVFKQRSEEWKEAETRVNDINRAKLDEYEMVWKDDKASIDQKMQMMQLVATKYNDEKTYNIAKLRDFEKLAEFEQKERDAQDLREQRSGLISAQVTNLNKKTEMMQGMGQQALKDLADRAIDGDPSALSQMGRSIGSMSAAQNMISARLQERGLTLQDMESNKKKWGGEVSYQRAAGTQAARVESAGNEVANLVPQAIETSRKLPREKLVPWNKLAQQFEAGTSDPKYYDFALANFALLNAYVRAMNPTGQPRITERLEAHASGILSQAIDQKSYEVQVRRLWQEVQSSKAAVSQTREGAKGAEPFPNIPSNGGAGDDEVGAAMKRLGL